MLDAFKGNVTSKIRAIFSLINTDLLLYLEDHSQKKQQVLHVAVNKSFKNHLNSCIVSGSVGVCRDPGQKNQESQYDSSLSVNHHIMVAHLIRSDSKGLKCSVHSMQCFMMIHCGKRVTGL